jgi:hypothetical protein
MVLYVRRTIFSATRNVVDADITRLLDGATWDAQDGIVFDTPTFGASSKQVGGAGKAKYDVTLTARTTVIVQHDTRPGDRALRVVLPLLPQVAAEYGAEVSGEIPASNVVVHGDASGRRGRLVVRGIAATVGAIGLLGALATAKRILFD